MTDTSTTTAGIDAAKDKLDAAIAGQPGSWTVANCAAGWKQLAAHFGKAGVGRVGIEATGGYERGVIRHLCAAGIEVIVLQPLQVKAFAKLTLQRAKTDRLDAALIATCTRMIDTADQMAPDVRFEALADHLTYIEQIEEDIIRFKTRLEHIVDKRRHQAVQTDITRLQKRRLKEMHLLLSAIRLHDDLAKRHALLLSIPGIGARTALALLVRMPELGHVSREAAAALAGLAPFTRQSGTQQGQARIGGGRARLRRSLFAAALPASFRWNPALKQLYDRLIARGKPHKCALVACARKLLVFANTVVARGTPWRDRADAAGEVQGFVT